MIEIFGNDVIFNISRAVIFDKDPISKINVFNEIINKNFLELVPKDEIKQFKKGFKKLIDHPQ